MAIPHIAFTVGPAGSGKTLTRCAYFLADDFLPFHQGKVITNFPINVDAMADFVAKKHKLDPEEIRQRIEIIPDEILKGWALEKAGPESYFSGRSLGGCHIAIDECHNFLGRKHSAEHRRKWSQFCGEIRHRGASIEFLTQDEAKLAGEVEDESIVRWKVTASESKRDPWFSISMGDWYELYGSVMGDYPNKVLLAEQRKTTRSTWETVLTTVFLHRPEYYALYESTNLPHGETAEEARVEKPLHLFQRLSFLGVSNWFVRRNWWQLSTRFVAVAVFVWFLFLGGSRVVSAELLRQFREVGKRAGTGGGTKVSTVNELKSSPTSQPVKPSRVVVSEAILPPQRVIEEVPRVIAFIDDVAVLEDGQILAVGDMCDVNSKAREPVRLIDPDRARVVLSSGRVLGFNRSVASHSFPVDEPVDGGTRPGSGFFRGRGRDFGASRQRDRSVTPDAGIRQAPESPNGGANRHRGSFGDSTGHVGSSEDGIE